MSYLVLNDYKRIIQQGNLDQVITSDQDVLSAAAATAQSEAISYLVQKYDVTAEFTDTLPWDPAAIYKAGIRATINFPVYVAATSYVAGNMCAQNNKGYSCTSATTGNFDPTAWVEIGNVNDIYYAKLPDNQFDLYTYYNIGDSVFWKNNVYTCKIQTPSLTHEAALEYGTYDKIPPPNFFPDDPVNGAKYWGNPSAYSVTAGTLPTNTAYWIKGDNRDQQMLVYLLDIALYHAHTRIAAKNVPERIMFRYMGRPEDAAIKDGKTTFPSYSALGWLQACALGHVTPALPVKQPKQGSRLRYGGNVKTTNFY
jgi:hypothetical protein